uniref:Trophinin associated protein n=1 Tax=Monodelphis domestica TaxID=13616 RepID=K7E434_MONDO
MTSSRSLMDTPLQTSFSTPSRIPVLARKCLLLSDGRSQASDQENRDPKERMQKKFGAQLPQRDLIRPGHKLRPQTLSPKGTPRPRAPLEEISPCLVRQNGEVDSPPRPGTALRSGKKPFLSVDHCLDGKEPATARSTGRKARLMDPGDLATMLSSVEVTSSGQGCQAGLAQRVRIRENNQKGASYGAQVQTLGCGAKSSVFRRHQESTEGNVLSQTLVSSDSGRPWAKAHLPAPQPSGESAGPTSCSQSGPEAPSLAQQVPHKGAPEAPLPADCPGFPQTHSPLIHATPGHGARASPFGLASRVPVAHPPARASYSVLRHLAVFSRTPQAAPAPTPGARQEQSVVKRLYEESWESVERELEKPSPIASLNSMALEQSRPKEGSGDVEGVTVSSSVSPELSPTDVGVAVPSQKMSLDRMGPKEGLRDVGVAIASNRMSLELSKHERISILKQLLQQEVEGLATLEESHQSGTSPLKMMEPKLAMIPGTMEPSDHGSELPNLQGPKQHPDVGEPISPGGPGIGEPIQQPNHSVCAPASTTFSQCPLCGSIPLQSLGSLRSPMGTIGPAVLALCQQLNAWLEAIRLLYEGCLDDECAFYTGRGIPGPQRICKDPVATWLERQEAMDFVPISAPAP